jgi:hypothetical protein
MNCEPRSSLILHVHFRAQLQFFPQDFPKGAPIAALGFLIRDTGKEPRRENRICLWLDREGSEETSQPVILSRSPKDPRVISITSCLEALQKVASMPQLRISRFE